MFEKENIKCTNTLNYVKIMFKYLVNRFKNKINCLNFIKQQKFSLCFLA